MVDVDFSPAIVSQDDEDWEEGVQEGVVGRVVVVVWVEVLLLMHDRELVGEELHADEHIADQEDQHEHRNIGDIINCLHNDPKKLLKIFPEFCKLEDSDEAEDPESGEGTRAAVWPRRCLNWVWYGDIDSADYDDEAIKPVVFVLQIIFEASPDELQYQLKTEEAEEADINIIHDGIETLGTIIVR